MKKIKVIQAHSAGNLEFKVNGWMEKEYDPLLPDRIGKMTFHVTSGQDNECLYVCFIEISKT